MGESMSSASSVEQSNHSFRYTILNCTRLPGRLNAEETASLLGFQPHDIPVLVESGVLHPLGKPSQSTPKWFSSAEIESLRQDTKFLAKATRAVALRWKGKNARKKRSKNQLGRSESTPKLATERLVLLEKTSATSP
jgi:hypothetical protein